MMGSPDSLQGSDTGKQCHIQGTLEIFYNTGRAKDKMLGADPYKERIIKVPQDIEKRCPPYPLYKKKGSTIQTTLDKIFTNKYSFYCFFLISL